MRICLYRCQDQRTAYQDLFSSPIVTRDQTQVVRLGCRYLYPLSCLVGSCHGDFIKLSMIDLLNYQIGKKKQRCGIRFCVRSQASSMGVDQFSRSPDHGPCLHKETDPKKLPDSPKQPILSLSFSNWSTCHLLWLKEKVKVTRC